MKMIDKLINRIADRVVERIEENTVKIDGKKLKQEVEKLKYEEDSLQRIIKGYRTENIGNDIKLRAATTHDGVIADKIN